MKPGVSLFKSFTDALKKLYITKVSWYLLHFIKIDLHVSVNQLYPPVLDPLYFELYPLW